MLDAVQEVRHVQMNLKASVGEERRGLDLGLSRKNGSLLLYIRSALVSVVVIITNITNILIMIYYDYS